MAKSFIFELLFKRGFGNMGNFSKKGKAVVFTAAATGATFAGTYVTCFC